MKFVVRLAPTHGSNTGIHNVRTRRQDRSHIAVIVTLYSNHICTHNTMLELFIFYRWYCMYNIHYNIPYSVCELEHYSIDPNY